MTMKRTMGHKPLGVILLLALLAFLATACGGSDDNGRSSTALTPTLVIVLRPAITPIAPAATSLPASTPTDTPTPSPVAMPTASPTPSPTMTPSATPVPTATATATPTLPASVAVAKPTPSTELVYVGQPYAADGRPQVNISFDVEGDPQLLYQILDILDQFHYKTTFFLQGEWVASYPEAARRIAERGHELGNHSWTHGNFKQMSREEVSKELTDTEDLVLEVTGQSTKPYFRPPFGSRSEVSVQTAYELGWTTIIWTYGAEDWVEGATAETLYQNVFGKAMPGALYYMHTSRRIDVEALPRILQAFQDAGYALVSLSEILTRPPAGD